MPATEVTQNFFEAKPLWVGKVGAAGVASAVATTIPAQSAANLTNGNAYIVTVNRTDATGTVKHPANERETFIGKLSGTNFINCTRGVEGEAQAWEADTVLEILMTAEQWNKLIEGIEAEHGSDGKHKIDKLDAVRYAADAGATDAYAITLSPAPTAYYAGMQIIFKANTVNTGPCTLDVNALGAKNIKTLQGTDPISGQIPALSVVTVIYDGTSFILQTAMAVLDEDTFASDAADKLATQQSIKAYIASYVAAQLSGVGGKASLFENALINGNMDIWQRGTSFTNATTILNSDDKFLMDRWNLLSDGNNIVNVAQSTDKPDGSAFSAKFTVVTANKKFGIVYLMENKDTLKLDNKAVSLSFYAKTTAAKVINKLRAAVLTWGSTADSVTSDVVSAWNAQGSNPTWAANWTEENVATDLAITNAWAKYKVENILIDTATVNNIAVVIWVDDTDPAVNDELFITQVLLNEGAVAGTFMPRDFDTELTKCRRYFESSVSYGTALRTGWQKYHLPANANGHIAFDFTVRKRVAPTSTQCTIWNGATQNQAYNVQTGGTVNFTLIGQSYSDHGQMAGYDGANPFTAKEGYGFGWECDVEL